jgi:serine/threonine-protein kinase HipA
MVVNPLCRFRQRIRVRAVSRESGPRLRKAWPPSRRENSLRQHGARAKEDIQALWRRLVFNILISNTDDHVRNHGFLYPGQEGWRAVLCPRDGCRRLFRPGRSHSERPVASEVGKTVSKWRDEAARHGVSKTETDRMASAFEHDDPKLAQEK